MRKVIQHNQDTVFIPPLDEPSVSAPLRPSWWSRFRKSAVFVLKRWLERQVQRHRLRMQLYDMNTDHIEKDIGVPRGSLSREAHKPFWRD